MLLPFGTQSRLDKLLDSLKAHLFINQKDEEIFIEMVKELVLQDFVTHDQIKEDDRDSATITMQQ